ncbi:hypothetical protein CLR87_00040 [Staphylococcus epidermidis]|nr:hypothetical protein CLR87_00040 [Staphylococcus epidermidis]
MKKDLSHVVKKQINTQGPQQKEFHQEIPQTRQVGVWGPTKRISPRNSTDKASLDGRGGTQCSR